MAALRRLSARNVAALVRYAVLRLRFRRLKVPLFFVGPGAVVDVGADARLTFGRRVTFAREFTGRFYGRLAIGSDGYFSRGCTLVAQLDVAIGGNCLIAEDGSVHRHDHRPGGPDGPG